MTTRSSSGRVLDLDMREGARPLLFFKGGYERMHDAVTMTANDVALAARVVVALILVASGVGQAARRAPGGAHATAQQFGRYAWVALLVALALPVYELVLAVLLLVVDAAWPSYLALATFVVFTDRARAPGA